jgi:hypothetical protein
VIGDEDIATSDETAIDAYTTTTTRARIQGVRIGPSPDVSCGPIDLEAVVTGNTVATSFEHPMKQSCTSSSGQIFVLSKLRGYDLDSRTTGGVPLGNWKLYLDVSLEDAPDAGASESVDVTCHFELAFR